MLTYFPYWDISWLVAVSFTLGSLVWVLNGFFALLPIIDPSSDFPGEVIYGGGVTAFIGASIFEIGSVLLLLEAVNENRTGCFGWAVDHVFANDSEEGKRVGTEPAKEACTRHHQNTSNLVGLPATTITEESDPTPEGPRSWTWFPSANEMRTKFSHEIGFLASFIQLLSATIFGISGITALPGIYNHLTPALLDVWYWTPQVIGAAGFIMSSVLFMLETQTRWWRPALGTLGWHIGFWNLIGSIGFFLCPAFGYDSAGWAQEQAALATFWGSWAFLVGSAVQWYESLEKFPVVVEKVRRS